MRGWAVITCLVVLVSLVSTKPIVDPGLFVMQGVASCRDGKGYCMLGNNCTTDIDFLPDDKSGHCDGLMEAFTPKVSFVCCMYNPLGKKTSVPPTTTLSSVTNTDVFSIIVEEAPNPDDYNELPEDFDPNNIVDVVGVVTDHTGVLELITQPWTGTFPTKSSTTPTPPTSPTSTSTTFTAEPPTTATSATTVDQVTPHPEETPPERETTIGHETEQTSSATESYNDMLTVTDEPQQPGSGDPTTSSVSPPEEGIAEEVTSMNDDTDKPNRTDTVYLPSEPLVSNRPIVDLEGETQDDHTETTNDEPVSEDKEEEEKEDSTTEAVHENEDTGSVVNLEDNDIEATTPPTTTKSQVDLSITEASNIDLNVQKDKQTTVREELTDGTTESPLGIKMTMEGQMELDHSQNTEGNEDKNAEHSTMMITEPPVGHVETDKVGSEEKSTTIPDGSTTVTQRTTVDVEDTTTAIGITTLGTGGSSFLVGHESNKVPENLVTGPIYGETTEPNEKPDIAVADNAADGQSEAVTPSHTINEDTGNEEHDETVVVPETEKGNEDENAGTSPVPDVTSVSVEEKVPVESQGTENGESETASTVVTETSLQGTKTEDEQETETTALGMSSTTEEALTSEKVPVTSSIGLTPNFEDNDENAHEDNNHFTEESVTEGIGHHTMSHAVADHDDLEDQDAQDSFGNQAIIFPEVEGPHLEEDVIDQHVEETIAEEDFIDHEIGGPVEGNNVIDQHQDGGEAIGNVGTIDQQVESVIGDETIIDQQVEDNLIGDVPRPPATGQQRPLQAINQNLCGFRKYREPESVNIVSRILGANQATMIKWCWMAAIVEKNYAGDKYLCTGALIEPDLVLTTAACLSRIESRGLEAYRVVLGDSNLLMDLPYEVQFFDISEVVLHPNFLTSGGAHANDIGLVRLSGQAVLKDIVCLACVAQQDAEFATDSECYVTGYGQSRPPLHGYRDVPGVITEHDEGILRELKVPLLEEDRCRGALRNVTGSQLLAESDYFLCAGGLGEDGACYRTLDGGSPLTCRVHGRWYVAGLVSWSRDCTRPGVPNIYTRVSSYSSWVEANYLRMLGFVTHQIRLA